jgi:Domain of unknown function (DUF6285)
MRDLPSGTALLALARTVLIEELMPLLPPEHRFDALLVGNCLAIAEREAIAGADGPEAGVDELAALYRVDGGLPGGAKARCVGAERRPAADETARLWRRFAGDLRTGAFENSECDDRLARAILWRLTLGKLRLANPKFLSANGLGGYGGVGD